MNCPDFLEMIVKHVSHCLFSVLNSEAREASVPCYLTYSWGVERSIWVFSQAHLCKSERNWLKFELSSAITLSALITITDVTGLQGWCWWGLSITCTDHWKPFWLQFTKQKHIVGVGRQACKWLGQPNVTVGQHAQLWLTLHNLSVSHKPWNESRKTCIRFLKILFVHPLRGPRATQDRGILNEVVVNLSEGKDVHIMRICGHLSVV